MTWPQGDRRVAAAILLLAIAVRLVGAFLPMIHHPDEVWQYLEPAYGLVTGHSVVTWEYRSGMRGWLIPVVLAGPGWLAETIRPEGMLHLLFSRLVLAALSLTIVIFGGLMALRISRLHGLVVGLILGTAFELVYFSARALSDTIAVALFMPALWLITAPQLSTRRLLLAGLLMGLCFSVRFQLAPVLLVAAICCCRFRAGRWAAIMAGGLAGLAVGGSADALCGQTPFLWVVNNFRLNLVQNRSADFGIAPLWWYLTNQIGVWGWAAFPVIALAGLGARKMPLLFVLAATNVALHSLIPHKEYRFVFLSVVLALLLAGVGTAEVLRYLAGGGVVRRWSAGAAIVFWAFVSAATVTSAAGRDQWRTSHTLFDRMRAAHDADGCGLAAYYDGHGAPAAYSLYGRATPILLFDGPDAIAHLRSAMNQFDVMIGPPALPAGLGALRKGECFGSRPRGGVVPPPDYCVYTRPSGCAPPSPEFDINAVLVHRGE